jgi:hypothetical protein
MDEERFNMDMRKFLKQVGVTSQRAIEEAVHRAAAAGKLSPGAPLKAKMVLTIESLGLAHQVDGEIATG